MMKIIKLVEMEVRRTSSQYDFPVMITQSYVVQRYKR